MVLQHKLTLIRSHCTLIACSTESSVKFHPANDECCEGLGGQSYYSYHSLMFLYGHNSFYGHISFFGHVSFYGHVFFYSHNSLYGHISFYGYTSFYGHVSFMVIPPFMVMCSFMVIPCTQQLQIFTRQKDKAPASLLRR